MLEGWLAAVNSRNADTLRAFLEERLAPAALNERSAEDRARARLRLRHNAGPLAVERVLHASPSRAEALVRGALADEFFLLRLQTEARAPGRIVQLTIHPVPAPDDVAERGPLTDREAGERINALAARLADAEVFSGAVLFARFGEPLFTGAFGMADIANGAPNTLQTVFNLGSVGKMFTAVAIAQLAEEGRLAFTDAVGAHLPNLPHAAIRDRVTVHHLLTHTSGMGTFFNPLFRKADKARLRRVDDYDPLYLTEPLAFAPGARFSYSNSGFLVLGKILEAVTGEDYNSLMRRRVFEPAGMKDTGFTDLTRPHPARAVGYTRRDEAGRWTDGPRRPNTSVRFHVGSPAGGADSTVGDLLRFHTALRNGTLLRRPEALWTPYVTTDFDPRTRHGYGVYLDEEAGRVIAYHTGVFAGVNAHLEMHLATGHTLAVLSNDDPPAAARLARKTRAWIMRVPCGR